MSLYSGDYKIWTAQMKTEVREYDYFVRQIPGVILTNILPDIRVYSHILFSRAAFIENEGIIFFRWITQADSFTCFSFVKHAYPNISAREAVFRTKEMRFPYSGDTEDIIIDAALIKQENILPRLPPKFARTYLFNLDMFPESKNPSTVFLFDETNLKRLEKNNSIIE